MQFMRISLLCVLCIALLACSKDSNPSGNNNDDNNNNNSSKTSLLRFTLNGPDVTNKTYEMDPTFYNASYTYQEDEGYSLGILIGSNIVMNVGFFGKATGTYTIDENHFVGLSVNTDDESQLSLISGSGSLTILEANTGTGRLRGTFSGTFMSTENRSYTVTNGSFTIQRK